MSEQDGLTPELAALSEALKSLKPAAARVDPLAAAFAAGRRSALRPLRVWQSIAAVVLVAGTTTALLSLHRSAMAPPAVAPMIVQASEPIPAAQPISAQSWLALQATVSRNGVDAIPVSDIPSGNVMNVTNSSIQ
jgi:hypothetical protein